MDLIEELRAPVVERMVLRVFNQQIFTEDDFETQKEQVNRCFLKADYRKRFIEEYERALKTVYQHIGSGMKLDVRRIISVQVICLKRVIRGTIKNYIPTRLKYL